MNMDFFIIVNMYIAAGMVSDKTIVKVVCSLMAIVNFVGAFAS